MRYLILFLLLCLSAPAIAVEQAPIINPQLEFISARSSTLGGRNPAIADDIGNLFINPASIGAIDSINAALTSQRILEEIDYTTLQIGFPYWGYNWGISYGRRALDNIPETIPDPVRQIDSFSSKFDVIQGTVSKTFYHFFTFPKITLGANIKLYNQGMRNESRTLMGTDVGAIAEYDLSHPWISTIRLGASGLNIFSTSATYDTINATGKLNPQLLVGGSADMLDDQITVYASSFIDFVPGNLRWEETATAAEWSASDMFLLRGSLNYLHNSTQIEMKLGTGLLLNDVAAFGYKYYNLRFDYNFTMPHDNIDAVHTISLTLLGETKLNKPLINGYVPNKPIYTNQPLFSFAGQAPKKTQLIIYKNNVQSSTTKSNKRGQWTATNIPLDSGKNLLSVRAHSIDAKASTKTEPITVILDTTPPKLLVTVLLKKQSVITQITSDEPLRKIEGTLNQKKLVFRKSRDNRWQASTKIKNQKNFNESDIKIIQIVTYDLAGNETVYRKSIYYGNFKDLGNNPSQ
ncbi:MAG: hypothetical protein HRT90_01375 [Candidatus Margulisbacteria bacterium]|nr:hypothetical protein [Candidatus Margulisiibacteriota bacterium]